MSRLQEFCSKSKELANELVRCGSCQNILLHCGEYEIVKIEKYDEEGILCETCKKNNRKLEIVTIIFPAAIDADAEDDDENNYSIYQIPLSQLGLELLLEKAEEIEEEE
jgi:hypothetical protein